MIRVHWGPIPFRAIWVALVAFTWDGLCMSRCDGGQSCTIVGKRNGTDEGLDPDKLLYKFWYDFQPYVALGNTALYGGAVLDQAFTTWESCIDEFSSLGYDMQNVYPPMLNDGKIEEDGRTMCQQDPLEGLAIACVATTVNPFTNNGVYTIATANMHIRSDTDLPNPYTWTFSDASGGATKLSFLSVMTHEVGHLVGAGHSKDDCVAGSPCDNWDNFPTMHGNGDASCTNYIIGVHLVGQNGDHYLADDLTTTEQNFCLRVYSYLTPVELAIIQVSWVGSDVILHIANCEAHDLASIAAFVGGTAERTTATRAFAEVVPTSNSSADCALKIRTPPADSRFVWCLLRDGRWVGPLEIGRTSDAGKPKVEQMAIYPNPIARGGSVRFVLGQSGHGVADTGLVREFQFYDVAGRLIGHWECGEGVASPIPIGKIVGAGHSGIVLVSAIGVAGQPLASGRFVIAN